MKESGRFKERRSDYSRSAERRGILGGEVGHGKPLDAGTDIDTGAPLAERFLTSEKEPHVSPAASRYKWAGEGDSDIERDEYLETVKVLSRRPFWGESRMTDEEKRFMRRLHNTYREIGEELGISDMEHRLPDESQHHVFDTPEQYRMGLKQKLKLDDNAIAGRSEQGMQSPSEGVVLYRQDKPEKSQYVWAHEDGHAVALEHVSVGPSSYVIKSGYQDMQSPEYYHPDVAHGLTEGANDIYASTAMVRSGYKLPEVIGYQPLTVVMNSLVTEVAVDHDVPAEEIASGLIRGALTSDRSGLDPIRESVGEDGMNVLLNVRANIDVATAKEIAARLGLFYASPDLNRISEGKPIQYAPWLQK